MTRDLLITLPQMVEWSNYEQELIAAREGGDLLFKVSQFPHRGVIGARCYLLWRGQVRGWMTITDLREDDFNCSTTGARWKGKFIVRSGQFYRIPDGQKLTGFQGFRYYDPIKQMTGKQG